jgi:dienelactone hydrolase
VTRSDHPGSPARRSRHRHRSGGRRSRVIPLTLSAAALLAAGALTAAWAMTGTGPGRSARSENAAGPSRTPAGPSATPGPPSQTPAQRPSPPVRLPVGTIGSYQVTGRQLVLVDRSRAGLGPRVLPTFVRYPVIPAAAAAPGRLARGLFPLVVFAPGYTQCQGSYAALLNTWAGAGYVVAGVDFPRTSCHVASPDENDLVNQPADMSYVIRQMLAASAAPHGFLAGLIAPGRVAVAGHSDGGDTVAAIAANSCCRDPAVKAVMVFSGAEWPPMPGSYFTAATPPILFVQGDADDINPPADSVSMYQADTTGPRYYLDLFGQGHAPPYESRVPAALVVARVTVDFLDHYLADQSRAGAAMRLDADVAGVATLVSGGQSPP